MDKDKIKINTSFGNTSLLDAYPLIEEALIKLIFRLDWKDLILTELSNIYYVNEYEVFNDRCLFYFGFEISENEFRNMELKDFIIKFINLNPNYSFTQLSYDLTELKNKELKNRRDGFYNVELSDDEIVIKGKQYCFKDEKKAQLLVTEVIKSEYIFKDHLGNLHLNLNIQKDPKYKTFNEYEDLKKIILKTKRILNLVNKNPDLIDADLETRIWFLV